MATFVEMQGKKFKAKAKIQDNLTFPFAAYIIAWWCEEKTFDWLIDWWSDWYL